MQLSFPVHKLRYFKSALAIASLVTIQCLPALSQTPWINYPKSMLKAINYQWRVIDTYDNIIYVEEKADNNGSPMPFLNRSWGIDCYRKKMTGTFIVWQYQSGAWVSDNGTHSTDSNLSRKFDFFCTPAN